MSHKTIYVLMVLSAWFWAGAFIAGKYCTPYISPVALVFFRFLIAFLLLKMILKIWPIEESRRPQKHELKILVAAGIVGMFGYHMLFFGALHYTTATNASILAAINPILTVIFGAVFAKQYINKQMMAGIVLSFLGVILTITGVNTNIFHSFQAGVGDLLMLLAISMWAAYGIISKKSSFPPIQFTLYAFAIATILSAVPFLLEKPWEWMGTIPVTAWLAVLYMAVCPSVFSYCVLQIGIRKIGPQRAAIFGNLVPACSMLLAVLILGEDFQASKLLTMILIVAGVLICQIAGERFEKRKGEAWDTK